MKEVSIVIPVYNEEKAIKATLDELDHVMKTSGMNYEIVVVNDGSSDNTSAALQDLPVQFTVIEHPVNKGYGAALKTGIRNSKYDTITITDADATYPNDQILKLLEAFNQCSMVVGKRPFKKLPFFTKPAKWFITRLANYLVNYKIPDINSGFRVFRKQEAMQYFNIISDGFSFTTTITLAMLANGNPVKYIPIDYYNRKGKSKIRPLYDTMNFIQLIIRTVLYFNPLKIFVPVFFILVFLGMAVFAGSYFFLPRLLDVTTAIIFIAAIQVLAIGMIADLIDRRMRNNN